MSTVAAPHLFRPTTRTLPASWPLYALLLAYPLWWVLGAGYFIWPFLTFPLLLALLSRRDVLLPPRFGIWLLFLGWMLLSRTQLEGSAGSFAFVWRASVYLSATILFLYVFNAPRRHLSDRAVLTVLTLFWCEVIVGGFLGIALPRFTFDTPLAAVVPASFAQDGNVYLTLHPGFAEVQTILGYPVGRPSVLFPYSNHWGSCAAVLTPLVVALVAQMRPGIPRKALIGLLLASVVPMVFSLNRGVWLSLGVALAYLLLRTARVANARTVGIGAMALIATAVLIAATPLGTLTHDRVSKQSNSTETRQRVYQTTSEEVKRAPLLGHGSPVRPAAGTTTPPTGSQSQIGLILFSHGVPGLIFFLGFFVYCAVRSARGGSTMRLLAHLAILIALMEMLFYSFLPTTIHVLMIAAALAWRDVSNPRPEMS